MRLTLYTDFSLRVLIHLAVHEDSLYSIGEIAKTYMISHNHLMKVVNGLVSGGFIETVRGRRGGLRLSHATNTISVGAVVRHSEEGLHQLADCPSCVLSSACGLTGILAKGVEAMLRVFDSYTVEDLLADKAVMHRLAKRKPPLSFGLAE
ncbi:Rrf2 family nitric oxide-sensitive transcriptional repressor [Ochrobactrum daejeonense]|uniref:Rrf2 family nitric oxide-sensitive transcriptional repressor n=1 Tax=Brucella daejeonensis TaxID=659015 RepID=A0A7W9B0E2_9HYPH|nr:Rrf2 family transcriptional regulator [Brucella daejeonensis]MBB5703931.1 Rrf2 family nitric oxide-sensitive transcriptional repressor [Brucella daejeonensis]NKB79945.1 Rrf2 family transcriptional regulator [Brucella daejeonensis]